MRIFIVFVTIFYLFSFPVIAQELNDSEGVIADYDEELREFYLLGIGLLLDEGQEPLLKDIKDNSNILRGGESFGGINADLLDVNAAFKLYDNKQYEEAFKKLLDIARTGNPVAQETVGLMLVNGQGISADPKQAIRWFERASKKLRPLALHYLGTMYFQGIGVKRNVVQAAMWVTLAIKFYPEGGDGIKRAREDRENIILRLSLREQRGVQTRVNEWISKHSASVNAFNKRKRKKEKDARRKNEGAMP